jgi:RimJ/RimL family protein N-acetyltransferase
MIRHQYRLPLGLSQSRPEPLLDPALQLRQPVAADIDALAALVLDAYRGTIDDEGEDLDAARDFVAQSLSKAPLLAASWLALAGELPVAAVLLCRWREQPLVTFVVTRPAYKGRGLASLLVRRALRSLRDAGEAQLVAFITEGNIASERLFARLGFERVAAS